MSRATWVLLAQLAAVALALFNDGEAETWHDHACLTHAEQYANTYA